MWTLAAMAAVAAATPNVTLFKRTHASCAAGRDATFVTTKLGMAVSSNASYACAGAECADRVVATTLGNFEMHYFTSYVTPEKDVTTCDFAASFGAANAFASDSWTYSEWATQGVTFYVPTLHPHLRLWTREGVAYLARASSDAGGETLYSARVVVPHTGHVVEVVSNVTADAGSFGAYAADECGAASAPTRTVESMAKYWMAMGGELVNSAGLPDLLVVHVTQPVAERADVAKLGDFVATYSGASVDVAATVGDACGYGEITLPLGPYENDFYVPFDYAVGVRSVWNPAMPLDRVKFYEHYMADAIDHLAGANQGFSRYMDWHVGLMMLASDGADTWTSLEANAAALEAAGVGFHDGGDGSEGSNWSRGASGLGVEFHGHYSRGGEGTLLGEYGNINYCAPHAYGADDLYCPADYDAMCDEAGC